MWDVQNQYVNIGYTGGLVAFATFIAVISWSFARLGKARKAAARLGRPQWMLWCLGACLFANVVGFFGINYFDQSHVAWFSFLAMIAACSSTVMKEWSARRMETETEPTPDVPRMDLDPADPVAARMYAPELS
jgi:O-antigen ligase